MVSIKNVSNSVMSNPLTHVIVILFIIVILLTIIRLFHPSFNLGANVNGHFGSIKAGVNIEGFNNCKNSSDCGPEDNTICVSGKCETLELPGHITDNATRPT
jgi:hypothetical protein